MLSCIYYLTSETLQIPYYLLKIQFVFQFTAVKIFTAERLLTCSTDYERLSALEYFIMPQVVELFQFLVHCF